MCVGRHGALYRLSFVVFTTNLNSAYVYFLCLVQNPSSSDVHIIYWTTHCMSRSLSHLASLTKTIFVFCILSPGSAFYSPFAPVLLSVIKWRWPIYHPWVCFFTSSLQNIKLFLDLSSPSHSYDHSLDVLITDSHNHITPTTSIYPWLLSVYSQMFCPDLDR